MAGEQKQTLAEAIDAELAGDAGQTEDATILAESGADLGTTPTADADGSGPKPAAEAAKPAAKAEGEEGADASKQAAGELDADGKLKKPADDAVAKTDALLDPATGLPAKPKTEVSAPPSDDPARPLKNLTDDALAILPKGVKEETANRFKELTTRLKERGDRVGHVEREAQMYAGALASFETTPENVSRLAKFSRALSANTPESLEYALNEWKVIGRQLHEIRGLPFEYGTDIRVDPLAAHPDLQAKVADFSMTREDALKQAGDRAKTRIVDTNQQTQNQQAEAQQVMTRAYSEVHSIEKYWTDTLMTPEGSLIAMPNAFIDPVTQQPTSMLALVTAYAKQAGDQARSGQIHPAHAVQLVNQYAGRLGQAIITAKNNGTLPMRQGQGVRTPQAMRSGGNGGAPVTRVNDDDGSKGGSLYDAITAALA